MPLKDYKSHIIGAVASLVTATVVGAFGAYLSLKDTIAKQEVAITKLTENVQTLSQTVSAMNGKVEDWNRTTVLVGRHDDYLKKLADILSEADGETPVVRGTVKPTLSAGPWFSQRYVQEAPRLKLLMPAPEKPTEEMVEDLKEQLQQKELVDKPAPNPKP